MLIEQVTYGQVFLDDEDQSFARASKFILRDFELFRDINYGKYKYELAQKAKESRKNQVKISVKEIQLKPKIDTNDFKIKLQKSRKFLETGDKVKFTMRFRGREAEHPEFGQKVLDNYKEELSDISELESTSNPDGRSITMVLAPIGDRK